MVPGPHHNISSGLPDTREEETGMQPGHGSAMMQQQEMLMTEMWDALTDDQKKAMLKRALDGKIMMKKGMIEHFKFKIETFEMLKKMLDES